MVLILFFSYSQTIIHRFINLILYKILLQTCILMLNLLTKHWNARSGQYFWSLKNHEMVNIRFEQRKEDN